jgi:hypothetical protein
MKEGTAALVTFGKGGDTVYFTSVRNPHGKSQTSRSGYGSPENPHAADLEEHDDIPDGTPCIDKVPAIDHGDGVRMALKGPMVDVDLEPGALNECPAPSAWMIEALQGSFKTLALGQAFAKATKAEYGPLDSVDVRTYIELWREAGARIGSVQNQRFVWE